MSNGFTSFGSLGNLLPFLNLGIYIVAIVVAIDSSWRVEKRLKVFMNLFVCGLIITAIRIALGLSGLSENSNWVLLIRFGDLLAGILFIFAVVEMYRIIRSLNNERPNRR